MKASWLHVSDFHFRGGDPYDRDVVLRALVKSIRTYRDGGRRPDLVFATGDIAHSGQENEYEAAAEFLDALIEAAGVERRHLFVIPGNHDVDREQGVGLARTLASREEADRYFKPGSPKVHIAQKQRAFARWYNRYFEGVRTLPEDSTCGPVETVEVGGLKIGILPVNSALFCQDDHDHNALWVGRRCLDNALEKLRGLGTSLNIALVHHPLDWLSDIESSNIRGALSKRIDFVLRGHLHETDVERVAGVSGETLNFAAGALAAAKRHAVSCRDNDATRPLGCWLGRPIRRAPLRRRVLAAHREPRRSQSGGTSRPKARRPRRGAAGADRTGGGDTRL
jgi:predicted phosphodiesterase